MASYKEPETEFVENTGRASAHNDHHERDEAEQEQGESGVPPGYWTSYRFIGSCVAIVLLANNLFIGYSMPANILNVINADIGPDDQISLITLINTLIKGVGLLLVGSLSDVFGRRYFVVAGQACGFVGSIVAARADKVPTIIGANVLMGLAGATQVLYPLLSQEIVPNKYRGYSQALITVTLLPTLGFGPAFARMMVEYTSEGWRWCFWLNAITTGTSLLLFLFCYFPPNQDQLQETRTSRWATLASIDYGGLFLYSGGLICLLLALSWGGREYEWGSPAVISTLVIGVVGLIIFAFYEKFMPLKSALLPTKLFGTRNFVIAVIVGSVGQMSFYALNVIWPTHITALYTQDNMTVGLMSCTTGAALAFGEALTGPFCKKGSYLKYQMLAAVVGLATFCGIMSIADENRPNLAIAMTIMVGIFVGWIELICIVVAGLVVPPENIGTGQAFFASTRAVSGTIATSIYLSIYENRAEALLPGQVSAAAEASGLPKTSLETLLNALSSEVSGAIDSVPGMTDAIKEAVLEAQKHVYAESFRAVYLSSLAFAAIAFISVFFVTNDIDSYFTPFLNKTVSAQPARPGKHEDGKSLDV